MSETMAQKFDRWWAEYRVDNKKARVNFHVVGSLGELFRDAFLAGAAAERAERDQPQEIADA